MMKENHEMHGITERVIFKEPFEAGKYESAEEGKVKKGLLNHWSSPFLDDVITSFLSPSVSPNTYLAIQTNVWKLLNSFRGRSEALLHGDLHTGSVMIKEQDLSLKIIDPEFAMMGPMAFDIGMILSNLWMHFFSRETDTAQEIMEEEEKSPKGEWVLDEIISLWTSFSRQFTDLTITHNTKVSMPMEESVIKAVLEEFLRGVWRESVGFGAIETVRRIIGVAHVSDFDRDSLATSQKKALLFTFNLLASSTSQLPSSVHQLVLSLRPLSPS